MKIDLKVVVGFISGALISGGTTFLIMRSRYEKIIDEEVAAVKKVYDRDFKALNGIAKYNKEKAEEANDEVEYQKERVKIYRDAIKRYGGVDVKDPDEDNGAWLSEMEHPVDSDEDDGSEESEEAVEEGDDEEMVDGEQMSEELNERDLNADPYEINMDSFVNEYASFDKVTITYYSGDDTFANENEEIMDDYKDVLGEEFVEGLKDSTNLDPNNVRYIRNERLAIDYEVLISLEEYQETH